MAPKSSQPNLQFVHRVTMYMYGIRLLLSLALLSENIVVRILFCIVSSFSHDFSLFYISFFFFFLYIFVKLRKVGQATRFAPYLVISRYKMLRRWILLKEKRRKKKKRKKTRAFPFLFFFFFDRNGKRLEIRLRKCKWMYRGRYFARRRFRFLDAVSIGTRDKRLVNSN